MNLGKVEIWETSLDRIVTLREGAKGVLRPRPEFELRAIDRLILGKLGNRFLSSWSFDLTWEYLGIPHGAAVWRRLLREVCLPFLLPYPILAAVIDGDILSRPSSL